MASGPKAAFLQVEPLLRVIGASVTYVGEGDQARLVKVAHNVLLGVVTQALAEVTVLAQRGGVPRSVFLGFLNSRARNPARRLCSGGTPVEQKNGSGSAEFTGSPGDNVNYNGSLDSGASTSCGLLRSWTGFTAVPDRTRTPG